jgi:hypothetical protein
MVLTDTAIGVSIGPLEGFGAFVVALDIAGNFASEVRSGIEDAAGNQIALNFREPDFDLIEPGRVSWGVVKLNLRMKGEELSHSPGLVRRKVVRDDVDFLFRGLRGDHVGQEGDELGAGVARGRFAQDLPAGDLQGGIKRKSAMPEIFKPMALGTAWRQRQDWIEAIESLNGRLFIDTKDGGVGWRLKVEADNVCGLGLEIRVIAGHVVTPPGRLQTSLGPDTGHSHVAEAQCGGKFTRTPMRGTVGRFTVQGPINNAGFQALSARSHSLAWMASPETGDAFLQKALSPEFDGIDAARLAATDRRQALPARQTQDDPSSSHIIGSAALAAAYSFQLPSFRRTQSKGCWHEENHTPIPSDVTVTVH